VTPQSRIIFSSDHRSTNSRATTANQSQKREETFVLTYLYTWLSVHIHSERGQDLIEYAMLSGLIALALIGGALAFKGPLADMAGGIGNCIDFNNATTCAPF
jgi:Flp pilus assembly pilin Flp